jgi:hypothetical protein
MLTNGSVGSDTEGFLVSIWILPNRVDGPLDGSAKQHPLPRSNKSLNNITTGAKSTGTHISSTLL